MADTSIYAPLMKDVNPFEATNQYLDTAHKANANRLQGQEMQSRDIGIDKDKFELAMKSIGAVNAGLSSLLGDPEAGKADLTKKFTDIGVRLVKDNVYTAQHMAEAMKQWQDLGGDPRKQYQSLLNMNSQVQSAGERAQSFFGSPQAVSDQAGTRIVRLPGYPNLPGSEPAYVPNQYRPEQPQKDTNRFLPNGQPNPNYLSESTVGPAAPAGVQFMPPANGAPARAAVPSSRKVIGDKEAEAAGLYEPRPSRSGPLVTAAAPGVAETQLAQAQESQKVGSALNSRADTVPQRIADLNNMERDLEIAGGKFGPLVHSEKKANQIAARVLGFGITMSPQEVAAVENFDKIGNQIALNQAGALGVTDARVQTSMGANPNSDYSYLGNKGILPILKGNEDAIALKAREWKRYSKTNGAATYNDFSDEFNRSFNPQAFQFARMTPDQRSKFVASIPDKDQAAQLARDLVEYQKRGWITR